MGNAQNLPRVYMPFENEMFLKELSKVKKAKDVFKIRWLRQIDNFLLNRQDQKSFWFELVDYPDIHFNSVESIGEKLFKLFPKIESEIPILKLEYSPGQSSVRMKIAASPRLRPTFHYWSRNQP